MTLKIKFGVETNSIKEQLLEQGIYFKKLDLEEFEDSKISLEILLSKGYITQKTAYKITRKIEKHLFKQFDKAFESEEFDFIDSRIKESIRIFDFLEHINPMLEQFKQRLEEINSQSKKTEPTPIVEEKK